MKVLFVCGGNNPGGISPVVRAQGDSLVKAGIDLEYFLIEKKGMVGYAAATFKLWGRLRKNPVNLLHAHYGLSGWVAYCAKPRRMPLIISYMGSDICQKTWTAWFNRALQNKANHIIVKSNNLKKALKRKNGVSLIPNGVDLDHFIPLLKEDARRRLNLDQAKRIVLFLGNPHDVNKNFKLVEKAVALVSNRDIILLAPYPVALDQVPIFLNAADVLVLASRSEGSPNVIKEAMACNCPVISTPVGDVDWLIGGVAGNSVTDFYPENMAKTIKRVLDAGKRTNGRDRIIELDLDGNSIAAKIISVYEAQVKK